MFRLSAHILVISEPLGTPHEMSVGTPSSAQPTGRLMPQRSPQHAPPRVWTESLPGGVIGPATTGRVGGYKKSCAVSLFRQALACFQEQAAFYGFVRFVL